MITGSHQLGEMYRMTKTKDSLDNVIRALHNSVLEAQKLTDEQIVRQIGRYFEHGGEKGTLLGPEMLKISMPSQTASGEVEYKDVEIPKLALVPPSAMKLNTVALKFKAGLEGFGGERENHTYTASEEPKTNSGPIMVDLQGVFGDGPVVEVEITFENIEVPEAYHRLIEQLTLGSGH